MKMMIPATTRHPPVGSLDVPADVRLLVAGPGDEILREIHIRPENEEHQQQVSQIDEMLGLGEIGRSRGRSIRLQQNDDGKQRAVSDCAMTTMKPKMLLDQCAWRDMIQSTPASVISRT